MVGGVSGGADVERARDADAYIAAGHTRERACLNCGTTLIGSHCHDCGQRAHVHRTLGAFLHDLVHGVLHFEGKIWRTIPLLIWRPGRLTRAYIDGKRASYVSPIALFLFVFFLSFALFNALGGGSESPSVVGIEKVQAAHDANDRAIARLKKELPLQSGADRARTAARIRSLQKEQLGMRKALDVREASFGRDFNAGFRSETLPGSSTLARMIRHIRENPQLAIYKAQTSAYKYSWMLIPLSVPFVWLLFPFTRRFRGYDHTVFATYSITFMIALVAVASVCIWAGATLAGILILLYAPFHMYRQLRETYALSRFSAIWRMILLSVFAWVALGLFAAVIAAMAGA